MLRQITSTSQTFTAEIVRSWYWRGGLWAWGEIRTVVMMAYYFRDCSLSNLITSRDRFLWYDPGPRTRKCEVRPLRSRWYPRSLLRRRYKAAVDRSPSRRTSNPPLSAKARKRKWSKVWKNRYRFSREKSIVCPWHVHRRKRKVETTSI